MFDKKWDDLAINTLRINALSAIQAAKSGHPGIALGAAPIIHTIFTRHLNFCVNDINWINRDRFILSAGHGSALLYAQLRLLNLLDEKDLKNFRQLSSKTPGHPERGLTPGIEATTGPLGQGIAMAVGLALAEVNLSSQFKEINHYVFALCGDGDLQEGVAMEAISFAGKNNLKKLILLHDSNDVQLDTMVKKVFNENLKMKFKALNWNYILVKNPSVKNIDQAIIRAKKANKPTFIEVKTIIGFGSKHQNTPQVHGAPLSDEDFLNVKKSFNWTYEDFAIPQEVKQMYEQILKVQKIKYDAFDASKELKTFLTNKKMEIEVNFAKKNDSTRNYSGQIIQSLNKLFPQFIGGSADLSSSTKVLGGSGDFDVKNPSGRNILFGVREFSMACIANGIALHSNFRPFVSTFLVFSDYLKPAIRLASLMKLPTMFIFTHDSIFVGEDGPTHQPIEHHAMLRSIPDVDVIRPADEKETLGAYKIALENQDKPTILLLTRQNITSLENTSDLKIMQGLYHLIEKSANKWTIVASGSELASAAVLAKKFSTNLVSLSNWQGKVTWDVSKAISLEAASTFGWSKFAKFNIGIDTFGASGEGNQVYKHFGFDLASLEEKIQNIIKNNE